MTDKQKNNEIKELTCPFCGRVFKSLNDKQVLNNLNIHIVTQHQAHKEEGKN